MSNSYRENVLSRLTELLTEVGPVDRALDFGSGDGWFARSLLDAGLVSEVVPIDVKRRSSTYIEPLLYDGHRLPFDDGEFDLVYSVDVFHHTGDPAASLRDALRCCRSHFVLKDHTYTRRPTKLLIGALDELGNRRFGVRSNYHYQRGWEWLPVIEGEGFVREELRHPIVCETRPVLSRLANGYQFIGRWRRRVPTSSAPEETPGRA